MDDKKISKKFDTIIMGAIIGGAIGSVLGVTFAPKSGKETRKFLIEKGKQILEKNQSETSDATAKAPSKSIVKLILNFLKRKKTNSNRSAQGIKEIPVEPLDVDATHEGKKL